MELQPAPSWSRWTGRRLRAVYKPLRGEQPLWDFPGGLYRREVAAYALSEALGWGLVPPTVAREDGPFGEGSLQLFVEADYEQHYFTLLEEERFDGVLRAMCAFDVVANNADRKSGHVLRGYRRPPLGDRPRAVLPPSPKLRTVIWDFAGEEVPAPLLDDLVALAGDVPDDLARLLSAAELERLVERIGDLARTGAFPGPGRRPPLPLAPGLSPRQVGRPAVRDAPVPPTRPPSPSAAPGARPVSPAG